VRAKWTISGTESFTYNVAAGDSQYVVVLISTYDYATGTHSTYAVADRFPLTVGPVEAVPEPSTWAMMLAGFAGLSLVGYRRMKTTIGAAIG
jgi:hypothetical protein